MNGAIYQKVLRKCAFDRLRRVKRVKPAIAEYWNLHHDNAPKITKFLTKNSIIISQPPQCRLGTNRNFPISKINPPSKDTTVCMHSHQSKCITIIMNVFFQNVKQILCKQTMLKPVVLNTTSSKKS